jgi:hypothetical protein
MTLSGPGMGYEEIHQMVTTTDICPSPSISNIYISSCYYIFSLFFYMKFSGTVFFFLFFQILCVHTRAIQQSKKEEEEEGGGHHKTVNGLDTIK